MTAKRKTHPKVAATGRPDYSEIEEMFEEAVAQCLGRTREVQFWQGVRDALGWVVGEYADRPEE